jgi:hypothetical protein
MRGSLRRPPVLHRVAVAVLLAASTVTGCSTATRSAARSATSAAATTLAQAAPATTTSAMPAPDPATSKEPAAGGAAGSRGARYVFPVRGCRVAYGHSHSYYPAIRPLISSPIAAARSLPPPTALSTRSAGSIVGTRPVTTAPTVAVCRFQSSGSTASATTAPTCSRSGRASATAPAYPPGDSWAASTTPATRAPPRPMSTSACPGRLHRASGGSAVVLCTPGRTWMPGGPVATSLRLRRSKPPTPPPAVTSPPVASAARCCLS